MQIGVVNELELCSGGSEFNIQTGATSAAGLTWGLVLNGAAHVTGLVQVVLLVAVPPAVLDQQGGDGVKGELLVVVAEAPLDHFEPRGCDEQSESQ